MKILQALIVLIFLYTKPSGGFTQQMDTLFYSGDYSLSYRYLMYDSAERVSDAIYLICELDGTTFTSLEFSFQILNNGRLDNIEIFGEITESTIHNLKVKLGSVQLFKYSYHHHVIYATYRLEGNSSEKKLKKQKVENPFAIVEEIPIQEKHLTEITRIVEREIDEFYFTSPDKVRTLVKVELYKELVKVSILKGHNEVLDLVVSNAVKNVLSDLNLNQAVRGNRNKRIAKVAFPIITPAIKEHRLHLPFDLIHEPKFRLKKVTFYDGINIANPISTQTLNSTTLKKEVEKTYYYDSKGRINAIERITYQNDTIITYLDSVFYFNNNYVKIFNSNDSKEYAREISNYQHLLNTLNWQQKMIIHEGSSEVTYISRNEEAVVKRTSIRKVHIRNRFDKILYKYRNSDSGRVSSIDYKIKRVEHPNSGKSSYSYHYTKDGYKVTWSDGYWFDSNTYFFNENGYLIGKVNESDHQPFITVYEYEKGVGNASLFENNRFDLIHFNPVIY